MRLVIRRAFRKHAPGAVVDEAPDGETALALLDQGRYDVVVADYRMGSTTGIDVLERVHRVAPGTVRLLMTGYADPALRRTADERARVHGFFEKPMSSEEFERWVVDGIVGPFLEPR